MKLPCTKSDWIHIRDCSIWGIFGFFLKVSVTVFGHSEVMRNKENSIKNQQKGTQTATMSVKCQLEQKRKYMSQ